MPCTIGALAKKAGLSRSTLLYYDSIGLLCPSGRTSAGYRIYGEDDLERLEKIIAFRETGLSLGDISGILNSEPDIEEISIAAALLKRLGGLNAEIASCRSQQSVIIAILKRQDLIKGIKESGSEAWKAVLDLSGIGEESAVKWHSNFERYSPGEHYEFLKSIGFSEKEISGVLSLSREEWR